MKRIILCLSLFAFFGSQAQQINPVPDYVFSNKMSVGRNAVTDTAAYFSIGPRYGAIRGFMPPMVVDTALVTGTKRNGLTIFSIQKNKYMYWDSVRVQWSDFAGSSGAYIFATDTSSMLSPYIRHAGNGLTKSGQSLLVDTAAIATRARVQKAVDSINSNVALKVNISDTATMLNPYTRGSGTVNYVPKFTGTRTLGDGSIVDLSTSERLRIFANGRVGVNTITDAGYQFDVAGSMRNTTGAAFATSSGNVGVGTTTNNGKFDVLSTNLSASGWGNINIYTSDAQAANLGGSISFGGLFSAATTHWASIGGRKENSVSGDYGGYLALATRKNGDGNNSERLRITSIGNVGIGTDSPSELLDVNGRIRARTIDSTSSPINVLTSDVNGVIRKTAVPSGGIGGSGTTNRVAKFTASGTVGNSSIADSASSVALTITSGGNLGLGVTPNVWHPDYMTLQIKGGMSLFNNGGSNFLALSSNAFTNTSLLNTYIASTTATRYRQDGGQHIWENAASGTAGNTISFNQALTLSASSELLINTTTDAGDYKLQVNGNSYVNGNEQVNGTISVNPSTAFGLNVIKTNTTSSAIQIYNNGGTSYVGTENSTGGNLFTGSLAYATVIGSGTNTALQFATNNTVRATISNGGNLLVNTTTDVASNYKLQVNGDIYTNALIYAVGSNAQITASSMSNIEAIVANSQSITGSNSKAAFYASSTWNTTGSPSLIDLYIVNTASGSNSNYIRAQDSNGGNIFRVTKNAEMITGIPSGGSSSKWKLGEAASVSPTSPNRTIRVEIDGTVYYLHAKTTND